MRAGTIFTPRGLRPYASISLRPRRTQKLTPEASVMFVVLFLLAIVVSVVIVLAMSN